MPEPLLDIDDVSRRYGSKTAVESASLRLERGQIACLLGPSGCGKSSLLRMIAGLEPIDGGVIHIDGAPVSLAGRIVPPEHRNVGLVFQDFALFPHLNVTDNVGFGLRSLSGVARAARVEALLARFHVEHLARAWPHTLSGGEQQRVAIARALALKPALLLLDEPFSGLDGHLRAAVRRSVLADLRDTGATVLIVTHDAEEAMAVADHLILMSDGRVLQAGSPEHCYREPVSIAAARLLGDAILIPADVRGGQATTPVGSFAIGEIADGRVEMLARPQALRIDDAADARLEILAIRFAGGGHVVDLRMNGDLISLVAPDGFAKRAGELVGIRLAVDQLHVFR